MQADEIKVMLIERGNFTLSKAKEIALCRSDPFFSSPVIDSCLIPHLMGYPLYVMANYKNSKELQPNNNEAVKFLIDLETGLAPEQWLIGRLGDCIIGRKDGIDFTYDEFLEIYNYIEYTLEELWGEIDPIPPTTYCLKSFIDFSTYKMEKSANDNIKYNNAKILKAKGLDFFQKEKYIMALIYFKRAFFNINYLKHKPEILQFKNSLILNFAICYNKLSLFKEALEVLETFQAYSNAKNQNAKFHFQQAIACANLGYLESAYEEMELLEKDFNMSFNSLEPIEAALKNGRKLKMRNYISQHKYKDYVSILELNIKYNRNFCNAGFTKEVYERCKEIYDLLGKEDDETIKKKFRKIYEMYGMNIMRACFYNITNVQLFDTEELESIVRYYMNDILTGIGGWLP